MTTFVLPDVLPYHVASTPCSYVYESTEATGKSRVHFTTHCMSVVLQGRKLLRTALGVESFEPGSAVLFAPGNYVSYEIAARDAASYRSILLFFEPGLADDLIPRTAAPAPDSSKEACLHHLSFPPNDYLLSFRKTITGLLEERETLSPALQKVKLLELLVYLHERDGDGVSRLLDRPPLPASETHLARVVENNVASDLTVEDLAFMCNMSLSTFKRRFEERYDDSPGRWIRRRRLEGAADLIRIHGRSPGEVFYEAGYADYSSFSHSFKKQFGVRPSEYRGR